ncbi:MAG: hypothetical protein K6F03_03640 [Saccharofermentans sp.]|nr:hypothetical protein [Saccharofermentans sp.]
MAADLKIEDYNAFDRNSDNERNNGKDSLIRRFLTLFGNRFLVLSLIFCSFGVAILVMTAKLQFSDYQKNMSEGSTGVLRQYVSEAPRGDILDSKGLKLASTTEYNTVMIANAYLSDTELNALCLELSDLFQKYHCISLSELDQYFTMDPNPTFLKEEDKIRAWQSNSNLFALEDYAQGVIVTYSDKYVKTDPNVFFLYLRQKFKLDNRYTIEEAYKIIRIRYQIFTDNWAFIKGTPIKIATDVPEDLIKIFAEENYHYMGIVCSKSYARYYAPEALYSCHVLGYVGQISQATFQDLSKFGYTNDDMVGKSGVESQMERYLHGDGGVTPYNIWTKQGEEGMFVPSNYGIQAKAGATVHLTIDSKLQKVGTDALKQYINDAQKEEASKHTGFKTASSGAFVMMNVNTGAVLAMGSYPNYDPNDFILANYGDAQAAEQVKYYLGLDEYAEMTANDLPLWNRAIMSMYAPGSTFKPITALAGLESGTITPESNWISCVSPLDVDGWIFRCLEYPYGGHGPLNLDSAMGTSCNIYFMRLGVSTGIDNISKMAKRFGLGVKTGIDLPGEIKGVMSSRETKRLLHESEYDKIWFPSNTAQVSIGQFDNCFTIMQLCRFVAGIATNKLVKPYIIDSVVASDGSILYKGQSESVDIGIPEENIVAVRNAMNCVTEGSKYWRGTAQRRFTTFPIKITCKTGTAETGFEKTKKEYSNGLFICYAPKDNPEVAIALVVEKGEWGASTTVIARKLIASYYNVVDNTSYPVYISNPTPGDHVD